MREKKCPSCGNRISSRFENSYPLPIPATTNEEVASLRQPKNSTSFETLVKVPLAQSGIYGVLFAIPLGSWFSIAMEVNPIGPIISIGFFTSGLAWTWHSHFFNSLLKPPAETKKEPSKEDSNQKTVTIEVTDKENRTMTTGSIPAEIATTEQIIDFAKNVKRDVERRPRKEIHLTQVRFTKFPSKIFSQPSWTEFIRILEGRKLVKRKNKDAVNSPYILTRAGLDFIYKFSELEL